jgi:hypothetical protein
MPEIPSRQPWCALQAFAMASGHATRIRGWSPPTIPEGLLACLGLG